MNSKITGSQSSAGVGGTARTQPQRPSTARELTLRLTATRRGARLARLLSASQLRSWGLPVDPVESVVAELAANAATHGRVSGRDFRLRMVATAETIRVELTDPRADRPLDPRGVAAVPDPERDGFAESGRGLLLVQGLASRWGVTEGPLPCKTVWAECDFAAEAGADAPA